MLITDQQILDGCRKKGNQNPTDMDVIAFRRFMAAFDCEDSETFEEAHEKIDMTLRDISDELATLPKELVGIRYAERLAKL